MKLSINAARPHAPGRLVDTIIGACAVFGLIVGLAATPAHAADAVRAMPASDFIDSLAVNTHVNYTDGAYVNVHNIADDLNWLGIRHVRDIVPNGSPPFDNYVYLARRGVKFNFLVRTNIDESIAQAVALNTAVPGSVAAIEGFNEIDNFPVTYNGLKGAAAGLASQRDIYSRVQTTPALAGVRVYDVTGYDPKGVDTRTSSADYSNTHVYPQNGEQPSYNANGDHWLPAALGSVKKFELPVVVTEFGYFSMPQSGWYMLGVDEPTQAKGVLNGYMDAAAAGVKRLFVYELLDQKPDPQNKNAEMHYGMFRNDNSPKVVAHTIRNLTTILNTNTPHRTKAAARDTLAYTLSGMPVSAYSLLLKKKDGRFVLALWNETPIWDRAKGTPLVSPPVPVQVGLGANARRVDVYDPMVSAEPLATHRNEGQISVDVPDHPILLEITPAGTPGT